MHSFNKFQMTDGSFREFVVREHPVWQPFNRTQAEVKEYPPWLFLTKEMALNNVTDFPPDDLRIMGSEFPEGAEIPAEDWAGEYDDVVLTATPNGFRVRAA